MIKFMLDQPLILLKEESSIKAIVIIHLEKNQYKLYRTIRQYNGWEYFIMEVIEKFECNTKNERLQREKELMMYYRANLNNNSAFRTNEERLEYQRKYNRDKRKKI